MTAEAAQREPTMEEILASIRRIISEEDAPSPTGADVLELAPASQTDSANDDFAAFNEEPVAPKNAASPAPVNPPAQAAGFEDDLMVMEAEEESAPEPQAAEVQPTPAFQAAPQPVSFGNSNSIDENLIGEPAASKAAGALGRLMGSMLVSSGATLDDVVRELLKPMLKEWLEANLPAIVEAGVAKEIERIRRMAR